MADAKETSAAPRLPERSEEARNLAREGLDEIKHGDEEEGEFLLDEARQLDKTAADEEAKAGKKR